MKHSALILLFFFGAFVFFVGGEWALRATAPEGGNDSDGTRAVNSQWDGFSMLSNLH
jgi:hypothetical protein